jgi:hypothetical protein
MLDKFRLKGIDSFCPDDNKLIASKKFDLISCEQSAKNFSTELRPVDVR